MMLFSIEAAISGEEPIGIDLVAFRCRTRIFWETLKSHILQGLIPYSNDQGASLFHTNH